MLGFHHPYTHAFVAAGVYISGIFDSHFCVSSVEAAYVFVAKAILAADENLPEGPVLFRAHDKSKIEPGHSPERSCLLTQPVFLLRQLPFAFCAFRRKPKLHPLPKLLLRELCGEL